MSKLFPKSYKKKTGFLIDSENNKKISYPELLDLSMKFEPKVSKEKKLIFLVSENTLDFLINYFCFDTK